ncbi:MAG: hypothetical protein ABR563_15855 [Pyrinomonadaceae bacterium]
MHGARRDKTRTPSRRRTQIARRLCALALASALSACAAASRGPDAGRPRANEPPYPVTLTADKDRTARALNAWAALAHGGGLAADAPAPELQPITATPRALPAGATGALRLPLVEIKSGNKENQDEATRESLRRFITSARDLLGVSLDQLSLTEIASDGTARVARYRQKPFPYPLRGGYGRLEIRFAPDRTVLALSSTAIPDTERLARALVVAEQQLKITADQVAQKLAGRTFTVTANAISATGTANPTAATNTSQSNANAAGAPNPNPPTAGETRTVAAGETVNVRQMVVYPVARDPGTLELHLAWEAQVGAAGDTFVYLDAVTGEILAATHEQPPPQLRESR